MTTCRKTDFDELYGVLCELVESVTTVPCWRKIGIQVQPQGPYATVYIAEGPSPVQDVVENLGATSVTVNSDPTLQESPVGLIRLDVRVEFFRNLTTLPALDSAIRFKRSLYLEARFNDLWQIAGLVGEIRTLDVSAMFRADVEGRAEVRFSLYANISAHRLTDDETSIYEIEHVGIDVYRTTDDPPKVASITINKEAS